MVCHTNKPGKMLPLLIGSEIVGSAELRKHKHKNEMGGKWGEEGPATLPFPVPFSFASSPLSESLEQAKILITK